MHVRFPAEALHRLGDLLELLARARDKDHLGAGLTELQRQLAADPARGPGHQDPLPGGRLGEAPLAEQVGVEVALPVVPELCRVGGERGDGDPGSAKRALGVAHVEVRVEVAVLEGRRRDVQVAQDGLADLRHGGNGVQPGGNRLRDHVREVRIHPHREARRVRRLGELVQHLADGERVGIGQVEGVARQVIRRLVGDVVHRTGHEVHRHDVHLLALRPHHREPLRQRVAQALDQLEEVIGPIDLVHLAGLRVADDDAGPVDAEGRLDPLPHQLLGLELGPVVRVGQLLPLVEHVLAEEALVAAGHGDRADVVEGADVDRAGELHDVACALHVGALHALLVRLHVVDRGEVEEVVDRLAEAVDSELLLGEVAGHRDDAIPGAEPLREVVQAAPRALAHERIDRALALEQELHEMAADEAGRARYEVAHDPLSLRIIGRASLPGRRRVALGA